MNRRSMFLPSQLSRIMLAVLLALGAVMATAPPSRAATTWGTANWYHSHGGDGMCGVLLQRATSGPAGFRIVATSVKYPRHAVSSNMKILVGGDGGAIFRDTWRDSPPGTISSYRWDGGGIGAWQPMTVSCAFIDYDGYLYQDSINIWP